MKNIPLIETAKRIGTLVENLKQNKEIQSLCIAKDNMVSTAFSKISSHGSMAISYNIIICCFTILMFSACTSRGHRVAVNNTETPIKVELSEEGTIEKIIVNGKKIEGDFNAETLLEDCDISLISSKQEENGQYVFVKSAKNRKTGNTCTITEYIYPTKNSIRWEIEIVGEKTPWSTPIVTSINYPANENVKYWTAWGRPQIEIDKLKDTVLKKELKLMTDVKNSWLNPLVSVPFTNSQYFYGAPYLTYDNPELVFCPIYFPFMKKRYNGAIISIPIVSIVDKNANYGVSFVLSPEDYTHDLTLETSEKGDIKFSRMFHRIVNTNHIKFAMDIVAHKPDWRCGLDWTSNRYSDYFEPVNKIAKEMYGTGAYSNFLLEQAQRHIDRIPDSYGFCIDRMDWLRFFNERTDDGRSWFANKPVGSLILSWQQFMEKFGTLVHKHNKVIFINNHTKRIDLLKYTDGFFDEFTYGESALNTTAFTAIKKPFSGWTSNVSNIKEDGPDNFFQKYLYMGAFPMCPFPGNDHSIRPDEWADRQYLDYGPLMQMMRGREWVLTDNPVVVEGGIAKANVFKVPDGYIVPVVFGETNTATIRVAIPITSNNLKVIVQHPGEKISSTINNGKVKNGELVLIVPLKRGCAMVKIQIQE